jgi:hypothetical protein
MRIAHFIEFGPIARERILRNIGFNEARAEQRNRYLMLIHFLAKRIKKTLNSMFARRIP